MSLVLAFGIAAGVSLAVSPLAQKLGFKIGAVDRPDHKRKLHPQPLSRLGGLAVFVGFMVALLATQHHYPRSLLALMVGVTLVFAVGVVDDIRGLSPAVRLVWQFVAAMVVLAGGVGITTLTNPFGGVLNLGVGRFAVNWGPLHFHIMPLANTLSLLWMVGLVNTINFLDGLDGLATGISGISALAMFLLAISPKVNQPEVALIAIIVAGACLGLLPFNSYPAKLFLGDGGAYFLGLMLAILAIYSGAKLATAVLVLGFTIVDSIWVVLRRVLKGGSPVQADRQHFHHRLLDIGLSQRQAVWLLYAVTAALGGLALVSGTVVKLVSITLLVVAMSVILTLLARRSTSN